MKEKKVLVSGCYDGVHDGQKYFLELASQFGLLHVSVASDETIIDLKGKGNENFKLLSNEEQRLKKISDFDFVYETFISSGMGEFNFIEDLERINPDILVVNNDGDSEKKRKLCEKYGMEYIVMKRIPRPGMLHVTSTQLREERGSNRQER